MEHFTQISANGPLIYYLMSGLRTMQNYNLLEGGSMSMNALLAKVTHYYI